MQIPLSSHKDFSPPWVESAVFYQIFPDRFNKSTSVKDEGVFVPWGSKPEYHNMMGGNIRGIIEKLEYLVDLGVNALYLCPIFTSASNHRYHTHDYFEIDPILGTLDDFKELVSAAHSQGIKIILDGVFNHCSRGFYQFNTVLEQGKDSPFRDWFHIYKYPIKPYVNSREVEYACWWNNKALPKFNTENPQVREFIFDVTEYWLKLGIDGWRLDVPNEINDDSFWQEFRIRVKKINKDAYIVGEIWENPDRWLKGDQFDGVMNYRLRQAILNLFFKVSKQDQSSLGNKISVEQFMRLIHEAMRVNAPFAQMNLLGSHDTHRIMTHAKKNRHKVEQCFALLFFLPGAPCIYYGDETGLTGGRDPECRKAFIWSCEQWDQPLRSFIKKLVEMRKNSIALQKGQLFMDFSHGTLEITRVYQNEKAQVALDLTAQSEGITFSFKTE